MCSSNSNSPDDLPAHWLAAIGREEVAAALESIYADAARAIAERGPACWASGRCCDFRTTGHLLYVTGLEAAYALKRLPEIAGTRRENFSEPHLSLPVLDNAISRGGCPFQIGHLCGMHAIKPLGCRVYFCDRTAQDWQHELSERLLADIRAIHEAHGIDYRYGEWRGMLRMFIEPEE